MVNFNVYKIMSRGLKRRRQRYGRIWHAVAAAARARALPMDCPVLNELHGATMAQSLEHNLPLAVDTLVSGAITTSLQADEGQDQAIQDQEQPRLDQDNIPEEQRREEEKPKEKEHPPQKEQPTPTEQLIPKEHPNV